MWHIGVAWAVLADKWSGLGLAALMTSSRSDMPELESLRLICNFTPTLLLLRLEQSRPVCSRPSSPFVLKQMEIEHAQNTYELQGHSSTGHHEAAQTSTVEDSATGRHGSLPTQHTFLLASDAYVKEA